MPVPPPANAQQVFHGEIVDVYQWPQVQYDGTTATFETVVRPDTVGVLAFLDPHTILLTRQEQPHKPEPFWDIPGGRVDAGETHETACRREFQEETGHVGARWLLWHRRPYVGLFRYEESLFLTTDLTLDPRGNHEDAGERITLVPTPWSEVVRLCLAKKIRTRHAMLAILAMAYDPENQTRLQQFLSAA